MAWCKTNIIVGNVNEACGLGFAQFKHIFHDFSTVAVILAAPALPSRLCRNWPGMDELASYEASIKSRDLKRACGLGFAPIQHLFSQFGCSPHSRRGTAPPSGRPLKWLRMDEMASYEATIKYRNVKRACGLGFAPI